MKTIIYTEFGPPEVLHIKEIKKPVPKKNEVLIKVHAVPVSFGDLLIRNFKEVSPKKFNMPFLFWLYAKFYFGFNKPKNRILGSEFSGVIEETGSDVKLYKKGDCVFGYTGPKMGTYSEFITIAENGLLKGKTDSITFEEAASLPYIAMMSLNLIRIILRDVKTIAGKKILIIGASRGIGLSLVQLSSYFSAKVTGICSNVNVEYIKQLGAEKVIDHTKEDFSLNGEKYDIIIDIAGKSKISKLKNSLQDNGVCYFVSFKFKQLIVMLLSSVFCGKKFKCTILNENPKDLEVINILIENGDYKPVIDRCFPPEKSADAHKYAQSRKNKGSAIINFENIH